MDHLRRSNGRGRGHMFPLQMWGNHASGNPGVNLIRPDPISGHYKLHVRSIPLDWSEVAVRNVLAAAGGSPTNVFVSPPHRGNSVTWAFVEFATFEEARLAVEVINKNHTLPIEVSFAREKPVIDAEEDPVLYTLQQSSFGSSKSLEKESSAESSTMWTKTISNNQPLSLNLKIEECRLIKTLEHQNLVEEALFHRVIKSYRNNPVTSKCKICDANTNLACSQCTAVFYCSEKCSTRDWPLHSKYCNPVCQENVGDQLRGGGDNKRQTRFEPSNGFRSQDSDKDYVSSKFDDKRNGNFDEGNRFRSYVSENKFGDKRNGNFDEGTRRQDGGRFKSDNSRFRSNQNGNDQQNRPQEKRNLFEERKSKFSSNRNETGVSNRTGLNQNNRRASDDKKACGPDQTSQEDVWDDIPKQHPPQKDSQVKPSSGSSPGTEFEKVEKAFLQSSFSSDIVVGKELKPDLFLQVIICYKAKTGGYFVQLPEKTKEFSDFSNKFNEEVEKASNLNFTPVKKDGICAIKLAGSWFRCKITELNPLTVVYIDLGFIEQAKPEELFIIPQKYRSLPPYGFFIKVADSVAETYLDKKLDQEEYIKLLNKEDFYWLVEVMGVKQTPPTTSNENDLRSVQESNAPQEVQNNQSPVEISSSDETSQKLDTKPLVQPSHNDKSQQSKSTQPSEENSSETTSTQYKFPDIFMLDGFASVIIFLCDPDNSGQQDIYTVCGKDSITEMSEMCEALTAGADSYEILTPQIGALGIAIYDSVWYRVKIVSLSPLSAYFIDYGNTEVITPEDFRMCPEKYKGLPDMVHKIKLAAGTSQKFFNLAPESFISVKPVSWLPDGTIVVQVEGENYEKPEAPDNVVNSTSTKLDISSQMENQAALPDTPVLNNQEQNNPPTEIDKPLLDCTGASSTIDTLSVDKSVYSPTQNFVIPPSAVELLQEGWEISFAPFKLDLMRKSLTGQVYTKEIPETLNFMADVEEFEQELCSQQYDPNFKFSPGELVGLKVNCARGIVLPNQGQFGLVDQGGVVLSEKLCKLPQKYIEIPLMAGVLTVPDDNISCLRSLCDQTEIKFVVNKITCSPKGKKVVEVITSFKDPKEEGHLNLKLCPWEYEPLETPNLLNSGDVLVVVKVIDSNTLFVTPSNDLEVQQAIQIESHKALREEFKVSPSVGDYVLYFDKGSDVYNRCRVNKVEKDEFNLFCVDNGESYMASFSDLRPLPPSLRMIPCRITQIELKDIEKVDLTEQAIKYLTMIAAEKFVKIELHDGVTSTATLTLEVEGENVNDKLKKLLVPQVVPDSSGKIMITSLAELRLPLNQEISFLITQTDPLYIQPIIGNTVRQFYEKHHPSIQDYCKENNKLYNPCEGELCLALFEGEWYRCHCLRETNTGISTLMLVDFGNIFQTSTSNIRQINKEMAAFPSIAVPCKIKGLPEEVSPDLKKQLEELLAPNSQHVGTVVAESDQSYELKIPAVDMILK